MSIVKRIAAPVGVSRQPGSKSAGTEGFICPHCHRQAQLVPLKGTRVCQICHLDPGE